MSKVELKTVEKPAPKATNRIPVEVAYLHQAVMAGAMIQSEKTLRTGIKYILELGPEGLWVTGEAKALVPHANIACVVLK